MKRKRDAAEQDPQGQNKKAKTEHDNAKAKSLLGSFFQSLRLLLGLSQMPSSEAPTQEEEASSSAVPLSTTEQLFQAVEAEQVQRVMSLLNNADVRVNAINQDGYTPLHLAVLKRNLRMVDMLLENGADPEILADGDTAAMMAAQKGGVAIVNLINFHRDYGKGLNINEERKKAYKRVQKLQADIFEHSDSHPIVQAFDVMYDRLNGQEKMLALHWQTVQLTKLKMTL